MREPSNIDHLYHYWRTALVDYAAAEQWRLENQDRLSWFNEPGAVEPFPMAFPGFFRTGLEGVAVWIEAPKDDAGELIGPEYVVLKRGHGKPITDPFSIFMSFSHARKTPVSEAAYRHWLAYGTWADDRAPQMKRAPVELRTQRSMF